MNFKWVVQHYIFSIENMYVCILYTNLKLTKQQKLEFSSSIPLIFAQLPFNFSIYTLLFLLFFCIAARHFDVGGDLKTNMNKEEGQTQHTTHTQRPKSFFSSSHSRDDEGQKNLHAPRGRCCLNVTLLAGTRRLYLFFLFFSILLVTSTKLSVCVYGGIVVGMDGRTLQAFKDHNRPGSNRDVVCGCWRTIRSPFMPPWEAAN